MLDQLDGGAWVVDLNHESLVGVVLQFDHDCFVSVVDVPEDSLAFLVKGPGDDDARDVGAGASPALGLSRDAGVCGSASNVCHRNGELALKGPQLVQALDLDGEVAAIDADRGHYVSWVVSWLVFGPSGPLCKRSKSRAPSRSRARPGRGSGSVDRRGLVGSSLEFSII